MSGETDITSEGGTGAPTTGLGGMSVPLGVYVDAMRAADLRFDAERDRRYTEGSQLRAEALKIKEQGDRDALKLAREIQTYKDEQHNGLLAQIKDERGDYPTRLELAAAVGKLEQAIRPLSEFVTAQQARHLGGQERRQGGVSQAQMVIAVVALIVTVLLANGVLK